MVTFLGLVVSGGLVVGLARDWWQHPDAVEEWQQQRSANGGVGKQLGAALGSAWDSDA